MKTILTKTTAILMAFFLWTLVSTAQTPIVTTVGNVSVCPGTQNVDVPIYVQNFNSVASISLKLLFNNVNTTYLNYVANPIVVASGGFLMVNTEGNSIAIAYFGLNPINVPDGQALFTFRFNVANSSTLVWNLAEQGACQYSDFIGDALPTQFVNGMINAGLPTGSISSTPFICSGQSAQVSIQLNGVAPYTIVYNDGVNPNDTVSTSANPYVFTTYPTTVTTYTLVSVGAGGCTNPSVNATATTAFIPSPEIFDVTGGGGYCQNQSGVDISLSGSQTSTNYEIYLDGVSTGTILPGTGSALFLGTFQAVGVYTVVATNECGNAQMNGSAIVSLLPPTEVTLESLPSMCISVTPFVLYGGLPEGGTYTGPGVIDNMFYPEIAGAGTWEITYTAAAQGSCPGSAVGTIFVAPLPVLTLNFTTTVCVNADPVLLYGYPDGGNFSGAGVTGNLFNPGQAGAGIHTITYSYSDEAGCSNVISSDLTVTALPVITFDPLAGVCHGSSAVSLVATPTGGWFEGVNVYQNENSWYFDAPNAGPAIYPITYFYSDENGCTSSMTQDITVFGLPEVSISMPDQICANASPVLLTGMPEGGVFTGNGVSGNTFDPSLVLPGSLYAVDYTYTDGNGCSNTAQQLIFVNYLPYLEIYLPESVCANSEVVQLTGYPAGGTFTGNGVFENIFTPSTAGAGTHEITYTFTDENGCTSSISGSITVNPAPSNLTITMPQQICANSEPIVLIGEPAGGVFNGEGVYPQPEGTDYLFYPSWVGAGTYTITYSVGNEFGCYSFVESQIIVNAVPVLSFDLPLTICHNANPINLSGTPSGGLFSGVGVTGNSFDPTFAEAGFYNAISYTFTSEEGCTAVLTQNIYINELTNLSFNPPATVCANAAQINLDMYTYPNGGTYSGTGILAGDANFNPALAGVGTHELLYVFTDENGCTTSITSSITVNAVSEVNFIGLPEFACVNADPIELNATPAGGTFNGDGVYFNTITEKFEFWPNYTFEGQNAISYTFINESGCESSTTGNITVVPVSMIVFTPVEPICESSAPVMLVATPDGGTFSGPGVTGNMFDPALTGIGSYTVTYTAVNEHGCISTSSIDIIVNSTLTVSTSLPENTCITTPPFMVYGYPEGGVFSGTGMIDNIFNPAVAGVGVHEITYIYTNESGCSGTITQPITVNALTELAFPAIAAVCNSSEAFMLVAYPEGGLFSGTGVSGDFFYPGLVEPGIYTLTYNYTNTGGCTSEITQTIEVTTNTLVTMDPLAPVCADGNPIVLIGQPEGGVFSGPGVEGNMFYPTLTGAGNYTITYTYGDITTCGSIATQEIYVIGLPSLTAPLDVTVNAGNNASFTVVSSSAYYLQWQVSNDGGANWNNLSNDATYDGVNSEILAIANVTQSMNGNMYHCLAFGDCPSFATSDAATLTVESGTITITAGSEAGCPGEFVVPVTVENFMNVASLSLSLAFDQNLLTYIGYSDLNPAIETGVININLLDNLVKIGYFNISPVSIGNGLLVNLIFNGVAGNSELNWDVVTPGNCQLTDLNSNAFNVNYVNGNINVAPLPAIFEVLGGGVYCENGNGFEITLSGSETGVSYSVLLDNVNIGNSLAGTGDVLSFGNFLAAGNYTIMAMNDIAGCMSTMSGSATIGINPALVVSAGSDVTINEGGSAALLAIVSGGTAPYNYLWTPANGLSDPTIADPTATPLTTTTYTVMVTDYYGCTNSSTVTVTVLISNNHFTGVVSYLNNGATPMNNVTVNLYDNLNNFVATTTTDANGYYGFFSLAVGNYHVVATTTKAWGGGNAADGLLMLQHFTGTHQLTGLKLAAGDVNGNGIVNANDALNTVKRYLGMIPNFAPVGDWLFESPSFTIDGIVAPVVNIQSLCYSDVNADYIPPFVKPEPTISLNREGSVLVNIDGHVVLPVISEQNLTVGAISMKLAIPAGVVVTKVIAANGDEILFNIVDNELRLGWYNLNPMNIAAGEILMNIHLNVVSANDLTITMEGSSVLSDENAVTIKGANLIIPKLSSETHELSINNYPNPVSSTTTVTYTLPASGKVSVKLFNIIGEQITELVNAEEVAGQHNLKLDAGSLSQGAYFLKIELNGQVKTHLFSITK